MTSVTSIRLPPSANFPGGQAYTDATEILQGTAQTPAQTHYSDLMQNKSHDYVGWNQQKMYFTATNTSEFLGFLAIGGPSGQPPFVLLDGVSLVAFVPEPEALPLMVLGFVGLLAVRRKLSQS